MTTGDDAHLGATERVVRAQAVGTNVLGFCWPPDGGNGRGALVGTDVLAFRQPPDLSTGRPIKMGIWSELGPLFVLGHLAVGTNVRKFH